MSDTEMSDTKHGWVSPRADGLRARCDGPGICTTCSTEREHEAMRAAVLAAPQIPTTAAHLALVASRTGKNLSLDEVGAVIDAINALGAADDTLARTGNTARDQEMYAAGRAVGEENAKHNAAIRGGVPDGWKLVPIEPTREMWAAVNKLDDEMAAGGYDGKGASIEQIWACLVDAAPSCLTCGGHGMVGGLTQHSGYDAEPCPDCAAPAVPVSTVEQGDAVKRLRDAIEGECSGVWISEKQAIAVLAHLNLPAPAAGDAQDALQYLADTEGAIESLTLGGKTRYRIWWPAVGEIQTEWFESPLAAIAAQRQGDA
ncbi:MAG: hypothetical protein ACN6O8_20285 [Achromobacter sp.]|uniref:hypothetical protein n=1 Tax=Achromobacter sp. TaxID=134375 RepID=UPI003D07CAC5